MYREISVTLLLGAVLVCAIYAGALFERQEGAFPPSSGVVVVRSAKSDQLDFLATSQFVVRRAKTDRLPVDPVRYQMTFAAVLPSSEPAGALTGAGVDRSQGDGDQIINHVAKSDRLTMLLPVQAVARTLKDDFRPIAIAALEPEVPAAKSPITEEPRAVVPARTSIARARRTKSLVVPTGARIKRDRKTTERKKTERQRTALNRWRDTANVLNWK